MKVTNTYLNNIKSFIGLDADNIKLICPTNHYSEEFYDPNKQTLILTNKIDKNIYL